VSDDSATSKPSTGLGVDSNGSPAVDPTANVIALSEASNRRQDDLRILTKELFDAKISHVKEISELRAEHAKEIGASETSRLNAIRQVDAQAVSTAADRAQTAIQALAVTTSANAENLRNALATTATTIAAQTAATVTAITERLAALEKSSYEGKGKAGIFDPMQAEMLAEIKALRVSQSQGTGRVEGVKDFRDYVGWGIAALLGLVALAQYLKP